MNFITLVINKSLVICICSLLIGLVVKSQPQVMPIFKNGDRVCFVGNSITHNGEFHHNILQYYVTRFPKQQVNFYNCGVSGDVTSGILQRVDDDIMVNKPTHVVIMIGMNDVQRILYGTVITTNADTLQMQQSALKTYNKNLDSIVRIFLAKGVKVLLQKPSIYDQTALLLRPNGLGVNDALKQCADYMQILAERYQLKTIDYWSLMTDITKKIQQKSDSATLSVGDRVHPNSTGHMIMTYQFLYSTNAPQVVSKIVLQKNQQAIAKQSRNSSVKKCIVKKGSIIANVLENALPFPTTESQQKALNLVPFMNQLNMELLLVKDLAKGNYQLKIDTSVIGIFPSYVLAEGINLAYYKNTPQYLQAVAVNASLNELWKIEANLRSVAYIGYKHLSSFSNKNDMVATRKYLDSVYDARFKGQTWYATNYDNYILYKPQQQVLLQKADSLRQHIYKLAQPVSHLFAIKKIQL